MGAGEFTESVLSNCFPRLKLQVRIAILVPDIDFHQAVRLPLEEHIQSWLLFNNSAAMLQSIGIGRQKWASLDTVEPQFPASPLYSDSN